jgi:hypothetical protein
VVAVPLAVEAGEKVPQDLPPQVTDQVTPPLLASLFTLAVIFVFAPGAIELGGGASKATEIAGGGMGPEPEPPPQAVIQTIDAATASIRNV